MRWSHYHYQRHGRAGSSSPVLLSSAGQQMLMCFDALWEAHTAQTIALLNQRRVLKSTILCGVFNSWLSKAKRHISRNTIFLLSSTVVEEWSFGLVLQAQELSTLLPLSQSWTPLFTKVKCPLPPGLFTVLLLEKTAPHYVLWDAIKTPPSLILRRMGPKLWHS